MTHADYIQVAVAFFAAVAALASWLAIFTAKCLKKDDELLAHATVTLERAYGALMNGQDGENIPKPNRLNWLTSARLIENYIATKKEIKSPEIRRRCDGHEEFWRNQFYNCLEPLSMNFAYYSPKKNGGLELHKGSAVIVHGFASWPKDRVDPIDSYKNLDEVVRVYGLSKHWAGLRQYVGDLNK